MYKERIFFEGLVDSWGCIRNLSEILCAGEACRQSKFDEVLADKGINAIMGGYRL